MLASRLESGNHRGRHALTTAIGGVTLLIVAAVLLPPQVAAASNPQNTVKQVIDEALPVLRDKQAPLTERRRKLRDLLQDHFDFRAMSRVALGYHWRQLTPEQRTQFSGLFTAFIENAYLNKIQYYSGQDVKITGQNTEGQGYARVRSEVVQPGKQPIQLDYLLDQKNDGWKIYDVTVDNISIISNYRNQFNRVINDQGYAKLVADLRAKQAALQASLGS